MELRTENFVDFDATVSYFSDLGICLHPNLCRFGHYPIDVSIFVVEGLVFEYLLDLCSGFFMTVL